MYFVPLNNSLKEKKNVWKYQSYNGMLKYYLKYVLIGGLSRKDKLEDKYILFCEMHKDVWESFVTSETQVLIPYIIFT